MLLWKWHLIIHTSHFRNKTRTNSEKRSHLKMTSWLSEKEKKKSSKLTFEQIGQNRPQQHINNQQALLYNCENQTE